MPNGSKNEITSARVFHYTPHQVFSAWADPQLLAQWWGPKGFTSTFEEFDFTNGGRWKFTMHGPDGTDYYNFNRFIEILQPLRIVFEHIEPVHTFRATVLFEKMGESTRLIFRMLFDSAGEYQKVKDFIVAANEENFDRLELVLKNIKQNNMPVNSDNTANRELSISRLLNAPRELVWEVWTHPEHIQHWWGPSGFKNSISKMDVKPEGEWEFVMHGPDGTDYKNKHIYKEIKKPEKIVMEHVTGPKFRMTVTFEKKGDQTLVTIHSVFESAEQLKEVIRVFKADEGMKQNVDRMEAYVKAQISLRTQLKTSNMARVSTYLNFPGNTEDAFLFYKSVFGGEFSGSGIQRFGSLPPMEGQPPLPEEDKQLILHIELPILGGHVLMASDAPQSMGFKVNFGNNYYINLEPDTRAETKRLFDALSAGGNVSMDLQDMFWGAYFGSCTDKYGVNWMFNCTAK